MTDLLKDAFVALAKLILSRGEDPRAVLDAELDAADLAAFAAIKALPED